MKDVKKVQSDSLRPEGNLDKNGKLNTATMKEMWDYESREPFSSKIEESSRKI